MINRRSLRIKAFKNLYSYESCKGANYLMGLDMIDKMFSPDLNSMEIIDKDELNRKKALAIEDFDHHFDEEKREFDSNPEVEKDVKEALNYVKNENRSDLKRLSKDLLDEAPKVTNDHLLVLSLLEEMAFQNKEYSDEKKSLAKILGEKVRSKTNLYNNRIVAELKKNDAYQKLKKDHKINWSSREDLLKNWYKIVHNKDEAYKAYIKKESANYEEDWEILDYLCRRVIFKNDIFTSFFEDIDMDWSENKPIVRSLVLKTLKSVKEESDDLQIADISYNWEDDSEYVEELFKITVQENDYLKNLLKGKLQNWDIERVAMTDKVLLKMALAELIYFPSIPTKVTINEFIEISKTFSTPKSKKFVNGILDGLATELVNKGIIRKSGRGLIDNK
ncbi:MAG: transcription antitermination factor NusB [Cyclobacteriaceae bacterium]|nr:transcription antitermination factor NusB [Cyclobacteriaceae bacterium]